MVVLEKVLKANSTLAKAAPRITALFVGGSSGIGQSTLRQLALNAEAPTAYIVGRSESKAAPLLRELSQINPRGTFRFVEADVSLMKNVDKACEDIKSREKSLNMLFMTPGGISLVGRRDTNEGIDKLFALRYYSRMRFVQNLLPLLEASDPPARVISVLGGGFEGNINPQDLDLKEGYNLVSCAMHSVTMTSLAMEHLAAQHRVSFSHVYPGIVLGTNIYNNSFPAPIAAIYNYGIGPMMYPFSVGREESGQRHLFHATSARFPAKGTSEGTALPEGEKVAVGSTGQSGSGAYLMNWKGDTFAAGRKMQRLREQGMAKKVWDHTTGLLNRAAQ